MSLDYTKLTVEDIRRLLVEDSNGLITEEMATNIKGKSSLIAAHETIIQQLNIDKYDVDDDVDVFDEEEREYPIARDDEDNRKENIWPSYSSPQWSDFVMSQFTEDELTDGNPNIHGLRRVAELLLGEIIESRVVELRSTPDPNMPGKATVVYEIVFAWALEAATSYVDIKVASLPLRRYQAVASSWVGNTDDEYAVYPEAIAETRAEARALRKALRINKVSADEITKRDTKQFVEKVLQDKDSEWNENEKATDMQVNVIKTMCDRLNIDVLKFINKNGDSYSQVEDVTKGVATKMISTLNAYQSNGNDVSIPTNLLKGITNES